MGAKLHITSLMFLSRYPIEAFIDKDIKVDSVLFATKINAYQHNKSLLDF